MTGLERPRVIADNLNKSTYTQANTSRDILDSLEQIKREQAEDHEIAEWVREQGGVENIQDELANDRELAMVVRDALWPDGKVQCCENGNEQIADELDKRLMPPLMEWPKVDGKPVEIGERLTGYGSGPDGYEVVGVRPTCNWVLVKARGGEILEWDASNCKRPKKGPIGADGLPIKVGQTVYATGNGVEVTVNSIIDDEGGAWTSNSRGNYFIWFDKLTHTKPVIGADHLPIKKGETVYHVLTRSEFVVVSVFDDGYVSVQEVGCGNYLYPLHADLLTHARPVPPDSWERVEEDVMVDAKDYCESHGIRPKYPKHSGKAKCEDLVRRCKALAGRA